MQKIADAGEILIEIEKRGVERLAAREGEQALGQRGGPLRAAQRVGDRALQVCGAFAQPLGLVPHPFQIAHDDH